LDEEDKEVNHKVVVKSDNLKRPSNEEVATKDVTKTAENFNGEEHLRCINGEVDKICAESASKTDLRLSSAKKTLTLVVSFNEDGGIQDVKVENEKETSKLMDFSVFKVPRFTIVVTSLTLMCLGHYTPQLHLVKYCLELGISADSASKLFIFIGLASSVARIVVGRLCDISWVNTIYVYQFGDLLVGFMTIALPLIKGYTGILVFAVVYGVGDGIFITTMNSLLMFTVDEKRRAAALGLGSCLLSLGIAGGAPLAGFLADTFNGYMWSFTVAGILMQCAGILPIILVYLKKEERKPKERQIIEPEQV